MEKQTLFELVHEMEQVTNKLIVKWNKAFNKNLGITHILVLSHLSENGKSRPSDIARSLGLTPPSLTHLSEKLIKNKLAERAGDPEDRRIVYLHITDLGLKTLEKAHKTGLELRRQLFGKLTKEEQTQLLYIYEKLNQE